MRDCTVVHANMLHGEEDLDVVFDVEAVVATDRALISLIMGALFDRFKLPGLSISIF